MSIFDDIMEWGVGCFLLLAVLATIIIVVGAGIEGIQSYRSFDAYAACKAKRMDYVRNFGSTKVICVPPVFRQDTTTFNINSK